MPVRVRLPGYLRAFAGGQAEVTLDTAPPTVGAALESLFALHPSLRDRVLTEQGEIRQHVNVFAGEESIRFTGGLPTALAADAVVTILPAVSGGGWPAGGGSHTSE